LAHGLLAAPEVKGPLYTTELGTRGPRIAFCHGLFGQGKNWTTIAKALANEYRLTLIDLPNHGRSAWTDNVSYAQMALAVGDLLAELAAGGQVTVVGHSMGGKVAMTLALQRPQLVQRLCVVDIAPVRYPGVTDFGEFVAGMRALDLSRLTDRTSADRGLEQYVPDQTVRSFLLQSLRRDGSGWRWQLNLNLLGDHLDDVSDWPELHVEPFWGPTLWIAGTESDYIRPDDVPTMRALFPKVQLVKVKRSGHWVHSERPEVLVSALRKFVPTSGI
jgi:pimeloyl-ACP methyl ester carboxylesterase